MQNKEESSLFLALVHLNAYHLKLNYFNDVNYFRNVHKSNNCIFLNCICYIKMQNQVRYIFFNLPIIGNREWYSSKSHCFKSACVCVCGGGGWVGDFFHILTTIYWGCHNVWEEFLLYIKSNFDTHTHTQFIL